MSDMLWKGGISGFDPTTFERVPRYSWNMFNEGNFLEQVVSL